VKKSNQIAAPQKNDQFQFHPSQLSGADRARHMTDALLDYNKGLIKNNPSGAKLKFEKLATSPFTFLRGTADLMYRDFHGTDADKSIVLCVGDVHLQNYGVMEADNGKLVWGINDFDEAQFAPFSWDVKRGAVSIVLAALEAGKFSKKARKKLAQAFAKAYINKIAESINKKKIPSVLSRSDCSKLIRSVLKEASAIKEKEWLKKRYLDPTVSSPRFRNTDEVFRIKTKRASLLKKVQKPLDHYLASLQKMNKKVPKKLKVIDVATKAGSGTASIGLWRYYVLVEGQIKKKSSLFILELKQERPSVLDPFVGNGLLTFSSHGSRVAYAENTHLPKANPFYGYTEVQGISYLVRKRSPFKRSVELKDLSNEKAFLSYVESCGKTLALAHLQSDEVLEDVYPDIAASILHTAHPGSFSDDISGFAVKMAEQVVRDWELYRDAHRKGLLGAKN
jgi:uncharacterized protein (DUF2252 family)